jgi:hypothetical protein
MKEEIEIKLASRGTGPRRVSVRRNRPLRKTNMQIGSDDGSDSFEALISRSRTIRSNKEELIPAAWQSRVVFGIVKLATQVATRPRKGIIPPERILRL